jgi:hypothetical protein
MNKEKCGMKIAYKVIYNQDWVSFFNYTQEPMTPAHVDHMVDEVAEGGADLMLINPNGQRVSYPSRVWQTHWDGYKPGRPEWFEGVPQESLPKMFFGKDYQHHLGQLKRLADQGCDYLARALARCRQAGIVPGVSVRMNDSHGTYRSGRHPWVSDFYWDHPQWHLKKRFRGRNLLFMYTLDYRQPEVRQRFLALIRELVTGYSFEVLELDFLRHPPYFPQGNTEKHCGIMTEFVREVKQLLDSCDGDRSLFVRVPVTAAVAYDLGLDVGEWAGEGLINGVTASAFCHTAWEMEVDEFSRVLGDTVAFYAGAEYTASQPERFHIADYHKDPTRFMPLDERKLRGFAAAYHASGADGVYLFNFFVPRDRPVVADNEPKYAVLGELGEPAKLRGKPKTYTLTAGGKDWRYREVDGPEQVPCFMERDLPRTFSILMATEPVERSVEVEVFVEGDAGNRLEDLRLHINEFSAGDAAGIEPVSDDLLENPCRNDKPVNKIVFNASSEMLLEGRNRLVFHSACVPLTVLTIEVRVG